MTRAADALTLMTHDRVALHVEREGEGEGETMLLFNGLFCSTHYFGPWRAHFGRSHRVVTFDYRGHGQSGAAPDPSRVDMQALVGDAVAVLDGATGGKVILVGHSMGARVALEVAARRPERTGAVVMLCGSAYSTLGDSRGAQLVEALAARCLAAAGRAAPLTAMVRDAVARPGLLIRAGSLFGSLARETPRAPVEGLVRNVRALDVRLLTSLGRSYLAHASRAALAAIDEPVLQIVGERDTLAPPSHAREVAGLLRRGTTRVLEGCTHLALIERPEALHARVEEFLSARREGRRPEG